MKSIIVFALFATLTLGFRLSDDEDIFLRRIHGNCLEQNYIPSHFFSRRYEFRSSPAMAQHLHCLARNYGFISDMGHFDMDTLYSKLMEVCDVEDAQFIMNTCAIELESPYMTVTKFWYCLEEQGLPYMSRLLNYYR
ncbi:unnamed protein product [Phyllotreta striolata]|uniref:Uncharacterized protein n=1 Tax=Phyllotreta striolata TaxID=444603 RepID=A0A9N9XMG8_PHYSR|nr:unnamed protein product [Phyllotreta striolata]